MSTVAICVVPVLQSNNVAAARRGSLAPGCHARMSALAGSSSWTWVKRVSAPSPLDVRNSSAASATSSSLRGSRGWASSAPAGFLVARMFATGSLDFCRLSWFSRRVLNEAASFSVLPAGPALGDREPTRGTAADEADRRLDRKNSPGRSPCVLDRGDLPLIRQYRDEADRLSHGQRAL